MKITFKNTISAMAASMMMCLAMADDIPAGKAQFNKIKSNQYVVTQEVDSVFTAWTNGNQVAFKADTNNFYIGGESLAQLLVDQTSSETDPRFNSWKTSSYSIGIGKNSNADRNCVAIGVPLMQDNIWEDQSENYKKAFRNGFPWCDKFIGPAQAKDRSVSIGTAAKAMEMVSVAIGNQAHVEGMHFTPEGDAHLYTYTNKYKTIIKDLATGNETTNISEKIYVVDSSRYERLPYPKYDDNGDNVWIQRSNSNLVEVIDGVTVTKNIREFEWETTYLWDDSWISENEIERYVRNISTGQGNIPLLGATYGVGIGSRAYVFGIQGVAVGHYSRATRPWSMAIGAESHVLSEGSHGLGYNADVEKNSPYSLAIGPNTQVMENMTNAIVIGVPTMLPTRDENSLQPSMRPKAIKSNSINLVYNGDGINDFFIDDISLCDRLSFQTKVVGNQAKPTTAKDTQYMVNEILGIQGTSNMVWVAADGTIKIFTKKYVDAKIQGENVDNVTGDLSEVFINGKSLQEIIQQNSMQTIKDAAAQAITDVNSASNMTAIKAALTNFFNSITH